MARFQSITVNVADIVDLNEAIEEVFYCDECELMKESYIPENHPEELKCTCSEQDNTNDEFLYW